MLLAARATSSSPMTARCICPAVVTSIRTTSAGVGSATGPAISTSRGHLFYLGAIAEGVEAMRRLAGELLDAGTDFVKLCATGGIMTAESDPMALQYSREELRAAVEVAEARDTLVAAHVLSSAAVEQCVDVGVRSIEHAHSLPLSDHP